MLIKYVLTLGLFCCFINNCLAQTPLSGSVAGTLTKANSPYVINGSLTIPAGQTLTIEPGVEIRSSYYGDQIIVYGTLLAQGTASDSIRFLGFANSSYGTTHGGQLYFDANSTNSVLEYLAIDQWGETYGNGNTAALLSNTSSMSVVNSMVRNSKGVGIRIEPVSISPVISGVSFAGNGKAIDAPASSVGGISNLTNVAIQLRSTETTSSCRIPKPGLGSYYALNGGFPSTVTTIEPGVEIRSSSPTTKSRSTACCWLKAQPVTRSAF